MPLSTNIPDLSKELILCVNEDNPALAAKFTVPESLLIEHSAFFRAACRGEWTEPTSRVIRLPEVHAGPFRAYLYWTYKEKIPFDVDYDLREDEHPVWSFEAYPTLNELANLWILDDRLMTAKLRNAAMTTMLSILEVLLPGDGMEKAFPASMITYIWSMTTKDCALRQLVIDFYALLVTPEVVEGSIEQYHYDFVKDLALNGMKIGQNMADNIHPMNRKAGYYHELDKPCRRFIHGHASIDLKDESGTVVTARSTLFATPKEYINAVLSEPGYCEPVVKIQSGKDVWPVVKDETWDESFGTASTPRPLNFDS